jgi:dTDP-glucose 4,6-dehydratase
VINLDKLTYAANLDNLKDVEHNPHYRFIKGDICNKAIVARIIRDSDVIVNFAALTHVDRSIIKPDDFVKNNVLGTQVLLEFAKKYAIKRFVQISTDEVYGSIRKGFFKENDYLNPSNPYAATKAAADHLAHSYFFTYGLNTVITRSSNNFGPCQFPDKIIPLFIRNAILNRPLPLYAAGANIRDWLFVLDNCSAIDCVLHKGEAGKIYNIAAGNAMANLALTRLILEKLNRSLSLIEHVKDRPGHDFRYAMDSSRIRGLGWRPRYSFGKALDLTIAWYKDQLKVKKTR